jgi:hypothetical protein
MKGTDRYRVEDVTCELAGQSFRVVNMSVSGLFAECPSPPPEKAMLELLLRLPGEDATPIVGRVAWINDAAEPRHTTLPPGFGFLIQRIAFPAKMAILRHLRAVHPKSLRDR